MRRASIASPARPGWGGASCPMRTGPTPVCGWWACWMRAPVACRPGTSTASRPPRLRQCRLQAARQYPDAQNIYLVMDNWPVHFHPDALDALAQDSRLELLALPTYAPWLNPIEKLWRLVRQRVTHAQPLECRLRALPRSSAGAPARLSAGLAQPAQVCRLSSSMTIGSGHCPRPLVLELLVAAEN